MLAPHSDLDAYRMPEEDQRESLSGSAYDILWPASSDDFLELRQGPTAVLTLERTPTHLAVGAQGKKYSIPWEDDIRIIVDGPVVEICLRSGVFAAPMTAPEGSWALVGADARVHRLARR